jgi:acyl-CoA synthetase (AMP-forming)/AMP-acid ligase II
LTYPSITYGDYIRPIFEQFPDRVAFYYLGISITFRELDVLSNQFASFLIQHGCKAGDTVACHLPNVPAAYISAIGIQKAGCVFTGVSALLTPDELRYQLNDSGSKVLVTLDLLYGAVSKVIADTGVKAVLVTSVMDYLPTPPGGAPPGDLGAFPGIEVVRFAQALEKMPSDLVRVKVDPGDNMLMMYTGGTTGPPKGAILTHNNIVHHCVQVKHLGAHQAGSQHRPDGLSDVSPGGKLSLPCLSGCGLFAGRRPQPPGSAGRRRRPQAAQTDDHRQCADHLSGADETGRVPGPRFFDRRFLHERRLGLPG